MRLSTWVVRNFKDPITGVQTNDIERTFRHCKQFLRPHQSGGLPATSFDEFLYDWQFRWNHTQQPGSTPDTLVDALLHILSSWATANQIYLLFFQHINAYITYISEIYSRIYFRYILEICVDIWIYGHISTWYYIFWVNLDTKKWPYIAYISEIWKYGYKY